MVEWKKFLLKSSKSRRQQDSLDVCDSLDIVAPNSGLPSSIPAPEQAPVQVPVPVPAETVSGEIPPILPQIPSRNGDDFLPDDVRNYYYPDLEMESARRLLQDKPAGTFLLRHSQCASALYTLSVKGDRHVFNVRIFKRLESNGGYHLDAPKQLRKCFPSISDLLRHYSNSPRELIALCAAEGIDEKTTFRLMYPLSKSESTLNLAAASAAAGGDEENRTGARPVTRQVNGGSLKAMVKWL